MVVKTGDAELWNLLKYEEPIAYNCGDLGWNFDVYLTNGVAICAGYRNMPGTRAPEAEEYERRAKAINAWDNDISTEEKERQTKELLREFCEKVIDRVHPEK